MTGDKEYLIIKKPYLGSVARVAAEKDAKLIAKAPELLEALEDL